MKYALELVTQLFSDRLREYLLQGEDYETKKEKAERKESEMSKSISELRVQVIELQGENEKLRRNNDDLKCKIINLQEDLKMGEDVQKDFVKLSQSLQITLEGIRQADTQVRRQDDDDVEKCPNCSVTFTVTCRKQHCRHCGKIFCEKCLTKVVPSGPRQKMARVCDICHTVLTPNIAPYFSKKPPNSPL
ncbi:RUN and FYVE domain-containing protein 2-like [Condylostylus longicornis]|uniref:RUN and FYVE domain-containing protein 2-like n=1 Tax=Condylostylus longicornis TaxID=2530218 RepID=UPI00244DFEAD|nr:RUN and FYVE domain-containing protein 2-like [Condylostylus longicornis]